MRTLAALVFIAGAAALAIVLARLPTVADGRVIAADRLGEFRKDGVTRLDCDARIPIGRNGATFTCVAALASGGTQVVDFMLKLDGTLAWKPQPPTLGRLPRRPERGDAGTQDSPDAGDPRAAPQNRASRDPWGN